MITQISTISDMKNREISDIHKATLIGSSQLVEVTNGELGVGSTGYVYFVDYDKTRERIRKCQVTVFGI